MTAPDAPKPKRHVKDGTCRPWCGGLDKDCPVHGQPDAPKPANPHVMHCQAELGVCRGESYCACQCDRCKAAHAAGPAYYADHRGMDKTDAPKPGPPERVTLHQFGSQLETWLPAGYRYEHTRHDYIRADVHERMVEQLRQATKAIYDTIGNGKTARQMRASLRAAIAALPPEAK